MRRTKVEPSSKKPKALALSQREKKLVSGFAKGLSKTEAARRAGYAASTSKKKASSILQRPLIATALTRALEREGVKFSDIIRPVKEALTATITTQYQGQVRETQTPDYRLRLEAHDRAIQLYGGLPKQVELPAASQEPLTVIFESDGVHARAAIQVGGAQPRLAPKESATRKQAESVRLILDDADQPD